jgi:hypothetical protein
MFLFSGANFRSKRDSLLIPLAALVVSDYAVIHFLYGGKYSWFSPYTWVAFLLVGIIGWTLRGNSRWTRIALASLAGSAVFFLVSNFGVWAGWKLYPPTFAGLVDCYVAALPFFCNSVLGDLAYTALMFGSYQFLLRRQAVMAASKPS